MMVFDLENNSRTRTRSMQEQPQESPSNVWEEGWTECLTKKCRSSSLPFAAKLSTPQPEPHPQPQTPTNEVEKEKQLEEEKETCIICFGRFSRRHPKTKIPCQSSCNDTPVHIKCIYEWSQTKRGSSSSQSCGGCPLCRGPLNEIADYTPPDPLNTASLVMFACRKSFVTRPVPRRAGVVRCYIKAIREDSLFGGGIRYELYLQAPVVMRYPGGPLPNAESPAAGDRLLLVARRRALRNCIDITLDTDGRDFDRKGVQFVGCVKSSFSGLEHSILAPYVTDKAFVPKHKGSGNVYIELGAVKYTQNRVGRSVGPRRMQVSVPKVVQDIVVEPSLDSANQLVCGDIDSDSESDDDEGEENAKWTTSIYRPPKSSQTIKQKLRKGAEKVRETNSLLYGCNKQPYWLDSIQAYSLDFSGRVTLPSNKNFQLVLEGNPSMNPDSGVPRCTSQDVSLQFGKVIEAYTEVYTLDLQWPLSPLQAFGICLSACTQKLCCA